MKMKMMVQKRQPEEGDDWRDHWDGVGDALMGMQVQYVLEVVVQRRYWLVIIQQVQVSWQGVHHHCRYLRSLLHHLPPHHSFCVCFSSS